MHVVNGRAHTDNDALIDRDREMMTRIAEELVRPLWIDRAIEYIVNDVLEHIAIVGAE